MEHLSFHYGNKGFAFMADVLVGVVLVIIIIASAMYFSNTEQRQLSNNQLTKKTSDVMLLINKNDALDTFNQKVITGNITDRIPFSQDMMVNLTVKGFVLTQFQTIQEMQICLYDSDAFCPSSTIPNDRFVGSGKKIFPKSKLDSNNKKIISQFFIVRYWTWQRK